MNYLSRELEKYYKRQGNKILFHNGKTLNQVASEMWEYLDFSQIDASVISRVLKGKRLFTKNQLEVFCKCLNINEKEQETLFFYLSKDYCERYDLDLEVFFFLKKDLLRLLEESNDKIHQTFYNGRYAEVIKMTELTELYSEYTTATTFSDANNRQLAQVVGLNLFLKAQASMIFHAPSKTITLTLSDVKNMLRLSKKYKDQKLWCYANIMLAHTYYIAGGYSYCQKKRDFFLKAISFSKKAVDNLIDKDGLKLNALRIMAAIASYIYDKGTIKYAHDKAQQVLPQQSLTV